MECICIIMYYKGYLILYSKCQRSAHWAPGDTRWEEHAELGNRPGFQNSLDSAFVFSSVNYTREGRGGEGEKK